jgi:hypothetical protein
MATPPIRFPAAMPRFPATAAEIVIASSGRLPATDSRIIPPSASPSPYRSSSRSVALARFTPATQVASAAARKMASSAGVPRSLIRPHLPGVTAPSPTQKGRCPRYSRAIMATASFSRSTKGSPETSTIALAMVPPVNAYGLVPG